MRGFAGTPLAAGSVFGARWWSLRSAPGNAYGLTGAYGGSWQPGDNLASCPGPASPLWSAAGHGRIPGEHCGCGFWAYWKLRPSPLLGGSQPVAGVIEADGDITYGDQGFRCSRARIIALAPGFTITMPDPAWRGPGDDETERRRQLHEHLKSRFWRGPGGGAVFDALTGFIAAPPAPRVPDLDAQTELEHRLEETWAVPVYCTPAAMVAMHPPTTSYLPPQAPADPRAAGDYQAAIPVGACLAGIALSRIEKALGCPARLWHADGSECSHYVPPAWAKLPAPGSA